MSTKILKELSRYNIGTWADVVYRNALLYPDKEAFVHGSERITFAQYNARVNSLIHALQSMGVKKGDVVGTLSWNCLEVVEIFGAGEKGGFIVTPFNARLHPDELDYVINFSEANTIFIGPEFVEMANSLRPRLPKVKNFISLGGPIPKMRGYRDLLATYPTEEPDVRVEEDEPLFIIWTSGTTGLPKGAVYTHSRLIDQSRTQCIEFGLRSSDRFVVVQPLFHLGGISTFLSRFYVGACNIIMKAFDPKGTLQAIQDEKATGVVAVPTYLIAILALPDFDKYDLSSLKRVYYAAGFMPVDVLRKAIKQWGNIFIQGYGQTESGPDCSYLIPEDHVVIDKSPQEQKILTSAGRQTMGVHIRIVDEEGNDVPPGEEGEIIVQSRHNMVEYWHNPDKTRDTIIDGWLHTGDIGRYDEQGYIYIVDRKSDMIKSGGENIYPAEVEAVLYKHPAVQEVAVIGLPDPYWVEKVHAVVVLKKGMAVTADELITFCKNNLARYKAPKSVDLVDSLPKVPSGIKVSRREVKKKYLADLEKPA